MVDTGFRRIGLADTIDRGAGMMIPRSGTGGGGEYGADITDNLRTFAITREPVAWRTVFTVAHDIFDNWFELELEGEEQSEASQKFDEMVQQELTKLKAKEELMRMAVYERGYGWAILVLGYADDADNLKELLTHEKELREIKAYGPPQISKVTDIMDKKDPKFGLPKLYHINLSGEAGTLDVHYSRTIHFATRLLDHDYKGKSVLDPIWDDLTTLRNIRWGMGQTMYRYGSGFPDITFTGAEKSDIEDWIDSGAFENLSARTYFVHSENQLMEFKGLQGRALDPMNYYLPPMEHISCGTGIPLAILRGVQAGALTGSEVNQMEYYGLISDEQTGYERGIRKLIDIILELKDKQASSRLDVEIKKRTAENKVASASHSKLPHSQIGIDALTQQRAELENKVYNYKFNWLGGFELDEEKQQQILLAKAQELQLRGQWHTRNELRKMEDPDAEDLSEEQGGEELLGQFTMGKPQDGEEEDMRAPPKEAFQEGDSYVVTKLPRGTRRHRGSSRREDSHT